MADFTWSSVYGNEKDLDPKVFKTPFGDGYQQRFGMGLNNNPGMWNLPFNVTNSVADSIEAFFNARINGESFTWYPPGEATLIKVTWSQYKRVRSDYNRSNITVTFTQVYGE